MKLFLERLILPFAFACAALVPNAAAQKDAFTAPQKGSKPRVRVEIGSEGIRAGIDFGRESRDRYGRGRHERRPVITAPNCCSAVGGYYETVYENVWIPGATRQVWVPDRYDWVIDSCGRRHRVLVQHGHYATVCDPGRYERVARQVWVPRRTVCSHGHHAH